MTAVPAGRAPATCFAVVILAGSVVAAASARAQEKDQVQSTVYVRTDSDHTTVVTPALHVGANVTESTRVDLTYTIDVWTSASIDIVTSATPNVTEQRDEVDVAVSQALGDVTLGASYRHSIENDYESNGGSLGASLDLAQKNTTLALVARALFDQVWAAGGADDKQPATTLSARLAFTQVLDRSMLGQLSYEIGRHTGYLSSPYRVVRIADDLGVVPSTCVVPVDMCLPEKNPDERLRHAIALQLRRGLSDDFSLGAGYRFYLDDWQLVSHTAEIDLAFAPDAELLLDLSYRFYTQGKAEHYRPFYALDTLPAHYTSDKELTGLTAHRVALELTKLWALDDDGTMLRTLVMAGPTFYAYADFPLLERVSAFEVTLSAGVEL